MPLWFKVHEAWPRAGEKLTVAAADRRRRVRGLTAPETVHVSAETARMSVSQRRESGTAGGTAGVSRASITLSDEDNSRNYGDEDNTSDDKRDSGDDDQ
eukprot:7373536-Prymnesium_polylepis.1